MKARTNFKLWLVIIAVWLCSSGITAAVVRTVPMGYSNIQAAIDASVDGDTVIIRHGTYTGDGNRDINFLGKAITVTSLDPNDPSVVAETIIDCQGTEAEPHRGFYFLGGAGPDSVISGLTIRNAWYDYGGGIYCRYSSPTISNCIFSGNFAFLAGGGMCNDRSSNPIVTKCTFTDNLAASGGGIYNESGTPTVEDCAFVGNSAGVGGGMYNRYSYPIVNKCTFRDNSASDVGGGMRNYSSNPKVTNCTFSGNSAEDKGGGMYNFRSNPSLKNCTFSSNSADNSGGGIYNSSSNPTIENCTFSSNSAKYGSGMHNYNDSGPIVTNCILWADVPSEIDGDAPTVTYSNVQGGWIGTGNIDADPCFVNLGSDDFHLLPGSPCIDAGDPDYIAGPNERDIDGNPRIINGRVDIGVDEYRFSPYLYVPSSYSTIQSAIDAAVDGDTVIVAPGIYTGYGNRNIDFLGKAITVTSTSPNEPNIVAATIIDCQNSGRGFYFHSDEDSSSVLDGFSIINGNTTFGGAIYLKNSSPTINSCVLSENRGANGAAICCHYWSSAIISNCVISNNESSAVGCGIYGGGNLTVINCVIRGNKGTWGGASYDSGSSTFVNCIITDNTATHDAGGGIACWGDNPTIINCVIAGNRSNYRGGGISCGYRSSPTVINCIIWNNYAPHGPQIHLEDSSVLVRYTNVQSGWAGEGNINTDPCFANPGSNDFHLLPDSPCIDAGDPTSYFGLEPEPDGGRINMGAYGNTPEATCKYGLVLQSYNLISKTRVGRTTFEYVYTMTLNNNSDEDVSNVVVELLDAPNNVTILDPDVSFAYISAGESAVSDDTFSIIVDRAISVDATIISWRATFDTAGGGGTGQTMFTTTVILDDNPSDITGDGDVDFDDLAKLVEKWLWVGPAGSIPEDISKDGIVNFADFALLAENWNN